MYSLKGFISISTFEDNAVGNVAPLGELSTQSRTFSREIGKYTDSAFPDISLISFTSKYTDTGMVKASEAFVNEILTAAGWVYQEAIAGRISDDQTAFLSSINNEFAGSLENIASGAMVTDGTHWMPEYLIFTVRQTVAGIDTDNEIRIWFSDQAFQNQYDEYEILVVPPVDTLDDLFGNTADVQPLLQSRSVSDIFSKVEAVTGGDPYTFLRTETYEWIDPHDPQSTLDTNWTLVIYGAAGDNVDFIRQALTEHVLANSTHTREEWIEVLPELFRVTEFIIAPLWEQYSIPNQTLQAGIYRPAGRVLNLTAKARQACVGYPDAHVEQNVEYVNFLYKSLGLLICGGPENLGGVTRFTQQFSDYILVPTTSADFNRMAPSTQEWVLDMYDLIKEAERAKEFTSLPQGMSSVVREGLLYVAIRKDNINYLVVAKSNYDQES